jgi:hypothetical protein
MDSKYFLQKLNKKNKILNKIQLTLIFMIITSFIVGFFIRENSAGAGGFNGDFSHVWKNLQTFKNNTLIDSIKITAKKDSNLNEENYFQGTRPPLIYIFQSINPLIFSQNSFFINVFFISIFCFLFFLIVIKNIYSDQDKLTVLLISSLLLISPYFRTSGFWALEENYAIFTTIITSFFLIKFKNSEKKNSPKKNHLIAGLIFFSCLTVYFDQKFLIIPLISLFEILRSKSSKKVKIFCSITCALLSIPMLFLIKIWGNVIPANDAMVREVGKSIHLENMFYVVMLLGFYLFPFTIFHYANLKKIFYINKKNIFFSIFLIFNLIFFIFFYDLKNEINLGKGMFYKASLILFNDFTLRKLFLILSFIFGSASLIIFINNNIRNLLIIVYLVVLSIFIWPYFQEYIDPILIILILLFSTKKILINKLKSILIALYFLFFLIISSIYYYT